MIGFSEEDCTGPIRAVLIRNNLPVSCPFPAEALIEAIPEGATLLGDKGYDSNAIREAAAARNVWANIPNRSNRKQRFAFSPWLYKQRNLVERFFNRIKHFRGIATR